MERFSVKEELGMRIRVIIRNRLKKLESYWLPSFLGLLDSDFHVMKVQ